MKLANRVLLFALATILSVATPGFSQTVETVLNNGPSNNRIDLIFVGDGYQSSEIDSIYAGHVQDEIDYLFNGAFRNPFPRYQNFFNAHRVNVISNESGADQPPNGIFRDTALDASYWWGGTVERCLYLDTTKANQAVSVALAGSSIDIDARFGLVNDTKYGGCGGSWAVYAAGNNAATDIGVHELGHSLGNLADEYWTNGTTYTGNEPGSVNLTKNPSTGKWDRWLGYDDPQTNIGPIGYYEGGGYNQLGIFRPSNNSEMRSLNRPFDAISREQFIAKFYAEVDPLDGWLNNQFDLDNPESIWVDTVDPNVINVEWFVNGTSIGNHGESLDIPSLNLSPGQHVISARAYDAILDHSFTGSNLDWYRLENTSALQQSVAWDVDITYPGDFNNDGQYGCFDIDALMGQILLQSDLSFDMNDDGLLDEADIDAWLAIAGARELPSGNPFLRGDANLDGSVDASDFNIWNASKFTSNPFWCSGNFNADFVVDGSDFNIWNQNKFTSSGDSHLNAVPEPGVFALLMSTVIALFAVRRRIA